MFDIHIHIMSLSSDQQSRIFHFRIDFKRASNIIQKAIYENNPKQIYILLYRIVDPASLFTRTNHSFGGKQ